MIIWLGTNFTLESSLFAAVKLTKNADYDKYSFYWCGIGFDVCPFHYCQILMDLIKMQQNLELTIILMHILIIKRKLS